MSKTKNTKFDDEICRCGHSKGYHSGHNLGEHGGRYEKCECELYTWKAFINYQEV